jgi:hypothetical protein
MVLISTAPALRHYVGTLQYEVVVAAGLMAVLCLTVKGLEAGWPRSVAWACAAGVMGGALTLGREVFIGVVPILGVWLMTQVWPRVAVSRTLVLGFTFLALFAAPVASWSVLQSSRYGRTILMSDKGVAALALGNNPRASGTYNADAIVQPAGLAFIRERPTAALRLAGRKMLDFWGLRRDWWNVPRPAGLWLFRATGGLLPLDVTLPLARGGWPLVASLIGGGCCQLSWRRAARHTSRRSRRTGSLCRSCL